MPAPSRVTRPALAPPGDLRAALVGRTILRLYGWPGDGWQRGTVAGLCPRGGVLGVARDGIHPADVGAAQHGGLAARRSLLRRPLGAGVVRASDSDPSARRSLDPDSPTLTFGSVGGSSQIGLRPGPVRRPPHPLQRMGYIRRNRRGAR